VPKGHGTASVPSIPKKPLLLVQFVMLELPEAENVLTGHTEHLCLSSETGIEYNPAKHGLVIRMGQINSQVGTIGVVKMNALVGKVMVNSSIPDEFLIPDESLSGETRA